MPSIDKVKAEIASFEGFAVEIKTDVRSAAALRSYKRQYERRARENHTVADWKRLRFSTSYPDAEVTVLLGDGRAASDRMKLSKVRASHE